MLEAKCFRGIGIYHSSRHAVFSVNAISRIIFCAEVLQSKRPHRGYLYDVLAAFRPVEMGRVARENNYGNPHGTPQWKDGERERASDVFSPYLPLACLVYDNPKELDMAALDWSQCPAVESIPGKVSGAWVFRDTRMPVATVFENLEAGASIEEIIEWFDLTREQITAVLDFAARSLETPAHR